ncbi:hypothetical protein [Psychrobacter sp. BF1]|uniref:hypothetical protein n=1 Tax=Psychrobacter sp. BF1 TaxID=2821147 RepID=UPI001C4E1C06|nr:hypothetical protein [Psychrobacter sp. BF1]
MVFQIKDIQTYNPVVVKRKFEKLGLVAELEISDTASFNSALEKFQTQFVKNANPTEDDFLAENNHEKSLTNEKLMMILLGEYMIKSWNADKDGVQLEPNYQNLKLVTANYKSDEDLLEIMADLFGIAQEMLQEFREKSTAKTAAAAATKKKPLRSSPGIKKAVK